MYYNKQVAKQIQGIAILLMIYHHQFMQNSSFPHVSFIGLEMELAFAWFGKICVALLTFVSGFGLCYKIKEILKNNNKRNADVYANIMQVTLNKIYSFMKTYWYIYFLFIPLFILKGTIQGFYDVLKGAFLINTSFSGGWWYAKQYVVMLLLLPTAIILFGFVERRELKKGIIWSVVFFIETVIAYRFLGMVLLYFLIFLEGVSCSYFSIFEKIEKNILVNKDLLNRCLSFIVVIVIILLRMIFVKAPDDARIDIVITPALILSLSRIRVNSRILEGVGAISAYMWLISTAIQAVFNKYFIMLRYSAIIYLSVAFISFFVSIGVIKLKKLVETRLLVYKGGLG